MDRKPRKQLPGVTARRRKGGAGGAPECGGFSRVPRIHTVRVRIYVFLLSPPAPTTFLPERYYLSRSLQPPFSGFFVTQKSRKSRRSSSARLLPEGRKKVPSARAALRKRSENFCDFCEFLCDIYIPVWHTYFRVPDKSVPSVRSVWHLKRPGLNPSREIKKSLLDPYHWTNPEP